MKTLYRAAGLTDAEELTKMSMELYSEVASQKDLLENKIVATLRFYEANRNMGGVLMIDCGDRLAGYAIVFRFWSDEYGGLILGIDELYIRKEYRQQGVAGEFFESLMDDERESSGVIGVEMEVHPDNAVARGLYASLGLLKNENSFYIRLFGKE